MSVRRMSGFTIFEIMVTMAIAAVVAAFAIPSFQAVMSSSRLNAAAQEVSNSVALARNTAISRRRSVVWVPSAGSSPVWKLAMDSSVGPVLARHAIEGNMSLAYSVAFTEMTFQPNGYVQKTNGGATSAMDVTITLCDTSTRKESGRNVFITRVGRVRTAQHANATVCNP